GRRHVRPVLLGGTKRLFLSHGPRRSSVRHRQPRLTVTPRSAASQSRQFRERRVGLRTQARQQRLLIARELARRPAARQRALYMCDKPPRNSAATCRTGTPPSTAAGTCKRRSFEYGVPIVVPSVRIKPRPQESQILRSGNPLPIPLNRKPL